MRTCLFLALFLFVAAGAQPSAISLQKEAQSNQQKAKAIIDRMIQALGGQAYLTVHDSFSKGRYGRFHNDVEVGFSLYYRYWQWPDKERYDLGEDRMVAQLYLDDKIKEITYKGARDVDPVKENNTDMRLKIPRRHYTLDRVLREWLNQPGTILIYEGQTLANNRMADKVTVINGKNEAVTLLVSPDNHLPLEKQFTWRDPLFGDRDEISELFDNWRMVQGVNTPYTVQVLYNKHLLRQDSIISIAYNERPPDYYFTPVLIAQPETQPKKH